MPLRCLDDAQPWALSEAWWDLRQAAWMGQTNLLQEDTLDTDKEHSPGSQPSVQFCSMPALVFASSFPFSVSKPSVYFNRVKPSRPASHSHLASLISHCPYSPGGLSMFEPDSDSTAHVDSRSARQERPSPRAGLRWVPHVGVTWPSPESIIFPRSSLWSWSPHAPWQEAQDSLPADS